MEKKDNRSGIVIIDSSPGCEARFRRILELVKAGDMEAAKTIYDESKRLRALQVESNEEACADPGSETHTCGLHRSSRTEDEGR